MSAKILVFAGSARRDSLNKKLARVAASAAKQAGGDVTFLDLDDFQLPVYHGDLESKEGVPENARKLKILFKQHQALLVVSPENNASIPAMLKNTIDWISREDRGESGLVPYRGKVAALLSASPGALGGLRGLVHLRQVLANLGVLVLSEQFALPHAHEAFAEDGSMRDEKQHAIVAGICGRLIEVTSRLA
jgi:chromate reductase, NAD(P)H dehydrogenase (quinone)